MIFYDFTDEYHVNVNIALELANQSVHYIGLKHKPSDVINVCKLYFYDKELDRGRTSSLVNNYTNFSQLRQNVTVTFIFASKSPLLPTIPSTEAHQILTNN